MLRFLDRAPVRAASRRCRAGTSTRAQALSATLGVAQTFLPDALDGWDLALDEIVSRPDMFLDRLGGLGHVTARDAQRARLGCGRSRVLSRGAEPGGAVAADRDRRRGHRARVRATARRRARRRDRGPRAGRPRAARRSGADRRRRPRDPHPRRLPPRPDPVHRRPRLGDHRLRGRAGAAAARAPTEALAAARRRQHAAVVRLRDLGGRDPARRAGRPRSSSSAPASGSSSATSSTSTRRCCRPARPRSPAAVDLRAREGDLRAPVRARQPPRLGQHPGRRDPEAAGRRNDHRRVNRARRARPRASTPTRTPFSAPIRPTTASRSARCAPPRARSRRCSRTEPRSSSGRSTPAGCSRAWSRAPSCRCATGSRSTTATRTASRSTTRTRSRRRSASSTST